MAKNTTEKIEMEYPEKKRGLFLNFFYWFLIPVVFCIAVLVVITMFTEKNIFEYIEDLPFISSDKEKVSEGITTEAKEKLVTQQAELQEKEAEVANIQAQLDKTTEQNKELEAEIERLNYEIEKIQTNVEESQREFKDILSTYEKMAPKKSAPILVQMDQEEALRILSSLKPDTLKAIFEKMNPEDAAKFTQLLTE